MIVGMLKGSLENLCLVRRVAEGIEYLSNSDFTNVKAGIYHIQSNDLFYIVSEYETRQESDCALESHVKYIDIHSVIEGSEYIGYAPLLEQLVSKKYDDEHDYALYKGEASFIRMTPGMFSVFFPDDLHMPGVGENFDKVKKVVMKVRIGV